MRSTPRRTALDDLERRIKESEDELAHIQETIEADRGSGELPSQESLAEARRERDTRWTQLRDGLGRIARLEF